MENKETAVCRTIINIDKTAPKVTLISPGEGGRYNGAIEFSGLSSDDIELSSVEALLRKEIRRAMDYLSLYKVCILKRPFGVLLCGI